MPSFSKRTYPPINLKKKISGTSGVLRGRLGTSSLPPQTSAAPEHKKESAEVDRAPGQDVTRAPASQVLLTGGGPLEEARHEVERIPIKQIY